MFIIDLSAITNVIVFFPNKAFSTLRSFRYRRNYVHRERENLINAQCFVILHFNKILYQYFINRVLLCVYVNNYGPLDILNNKWTTIQLKIRPANEHVSKTRN